MPARATSRTRRPGLWAVMGFNLLTHPAIMASGKPDSLALASAAILLTTQNKTDGVLRISDAMHLARVTDYDVVESMIKHGFFHEHGHGCTRCPQPPKGHVIIHRHLAWNRPAELSSELSAKRAKNGSEGAKARWAKYRAAREERTAAAEAATAAVTHEGRLGKIEGMFTAAVEDTEQQPKKRGRKAKAKTAPPVQLALELQNSGSTSYPDTLTSPETDTHEAQAAAPVVKMTREELDENVDRLCTWFAKMIQKSTGAPVVPAHQAKTTWKDPMRRMITVDGYTVAQIMDAVRAAERSWWRGKTSNARYLRERIAQFHMLATKGELARPQTQPRNAYVQDRTKTYDQMTKDAERLLLGNRYDATGSDDTAPAAAVQRDLTLAWATAT